MGLHDWKPVEKLIGNFTRLCAVLDLKTSGGKIMLAFEFFITIVLAVVVLGFSTESLILNAIALIFSREVRIEYSSEPLYIFAFIIVLSMFFVFVREKI